MWIQITKVSEQPAPSNKLILQPVEGLRMKCGRSECQTKRDEHYLVKERLDWEVKLAPLLLDAMLYMLHQPLYKYPVTLLHYART